MKNKSMKNSPIKFTINRGFTMMISIGSINRLYTRSEKKRKIKKGKKKKKKYYTNWLPGFLNIPSRRFHLFKDQVCIFIGNTLLGYTVNYSFSNLSRHRTTRSTNI